MQEVNPSCHDDEKARHWHAAYSARSPLHDELRTLVRLLADTRPRSRNE